MDEKQDPQMENTLEPPKFDLLHILYKGDDDMIVIPYCEVANGDIKEIDEKEVYIQNIQTSEVLALELKDFIQVIEKSLEYKKIVQLHVQLANSFNKIQIIHES